MHPNDYETAEKEVVNVSELYEKRYVVIEYIPGGQGVCNEIVGSYEFVTEDAAIDFAKEKNEESDRDHSWLCYRVSERFVPYI